MAEFPTGKKNPFSLATKRLHRTFVLVGLFSAAVNILMLTGPMFMLQLYDRVMSSGSVATLQGLFVIVVVAFTFLGLYDFLRVRLLSRAGYRLDQTVGQPAFDIWVNAGLRGDSIGKPLSDLAILRGFIASPAVPAIFDLPWMPFYLFVVFIIHPWLGYLALFGAIVVTIAALLNQFLTRKAFVAAMVMDASESFFVDQSHRNAEAILPLGMLDKISNHWRAMHTDGLATGQVGGERAEGFSAFSKAFRMLLQSSLLALGGYLALNQEISAGMIVATSIIAGRALAPVDQVIGQWRSVVRAREAHRRLKALFAAQPEEPDRVQLPEPNGQLDVTGLTKFPPAARAKADRPPILHNVAFNLSAGDGLGVIGPSASGKSTLARLLVGAWVPDSGEVRLDGATLDQWAQVDLGRYIGYLPQSLELLAGSIKQNIARFDPEAEDEDVIAAAKIAGVHEMILKQPEGYATKLGYGTQALSGGQIQRIGLARAVYKTPKLVVLDEPNSNLDANGDEALAGAIAHLRSKGSVVVVMAHRPSAIAAVNKVLVLHEGTVAQFGDKAEVLQQATRSAPNKQIRKREADHANSS